MEGTVLLAMLLVVMLLQGIQCEEGAGRGAGPALDDEEDSALFAVVVQHAAGPRCAGALLSARTVLTSAPCAQPGGLTAGPLWVRAHLGPLHAVVRLILSADASLQLAVLEIQKALAPPSRPILVATALSECRAPADCHVAVTRAGRLRIQEQLLIAATTCADLVPHSPVGTLCLHGAPLCQDDGGAGVVCAGKLCGIVVQEDAGGMTCRSPRVAPSLPHHSQFLRCAHQPTACARGGACEYVCTETLLLELSNTSVPKPPLFFSTLTTESASALADRALVVAHTVAGAPLRTFSSAGGAPWVWLSVETAAPTERDPPSSVTRTTQRHSPSRSALAELRAAVTTAADGLLRPPIVFEPNRADFKPGEYGDSSVEYVADELGPPLRTVFVPRAPPPPARVSAELSARVSLAAATLPSLASAASYSSVRAGLVPVALLLTWQW